MENLDGFDANGNRPDEIEPRVGRLLPRRNSTTMITTTGSASDDPGERGVARVREPRMGHPDVA